MTKVRLVGESSPVAQEASVRLSLVVTVLNEASTAGDLLASIEAQTRSPDEVIIVDGGSSDGTWENLLAWAETQAAAQVLSIPGCTIAAGRNRGIERASGNVIAVTDAGVILDEHWLEQLASPFEHDPHLDVVAGFFLPDARNGFEQAMAATVLPSVQDVDGDRFLPSSRSVAFRRSAWQRVGGYPEWLDYCEDVVFDLALRRAGCGFVWQPKALVRFRPRRNLWVFFLQYYRYARGDGKADLWRWRHVIRWAAYAIGFFALVSRHPLAVLIAAAGMALYIRRPAERLGGLGASRSATLVGLGLIPVIRVTGDIAKMVGYPVGVAWRLWGKLAGQRPHYSIPFPAGEGASAKPDPSDGPTRAGLGVQKADNPLPQPEGASEVALSVILVSYNTRDALRSCLHCVEQSVGVAPVEVFVVDNASDDGSADLVADEFPWVQLIRSPINRGYAYGNNLALRQASGRFLLLLNPDTEFGPNVLAEMVSYLWANPDVAAVGPKIVLPDGRLDLACRRGFPTPAVAFYRLFGFSTLFPRSRRFGRYNLTYLDPDEEAEVDSVVGAFMLVRREVVEQVGLLDERYFMYAEDIDWALRMKERGWRIRYNPRVTVVHQKGASSRQSSQRTTVAFYRSMHMFHAKHFRARTFAPLNWLIVAGIYLRMLWSLGKNALRPSSIRRVAP